MNRIYLLLLLAAPLLADSQVLAASRVERGTLTFDNIPQVPADLAEKLDGYLNARQATPLGWSPKGNPDYLINAAQKSRERLKLERIDLWQLHRIDPKVPRDEQFAAIKSLIDRGVIRHAGLSEVSVEEIKAAQKVFPVATVQNRYNLADRQSEDVLDYCTEQSIGFIPWFPLAAGDLAKPGGALDKIAKAHKASAGAVALAWLLKRSPVMLPIPGTSSRAHLAENIEGAVIALSDAKFKSLSG